MKINRLRDLIFLLMAVLPGPLVMAVTVSDIMKQEEAITERGVQMRALDPVSPVTDQVWFNTAENQLRRFNGTATVSVAGSPKWVENAQTGTSYTAVLADGIGSGKANGVPYISLSNAAHINLTIPSNANVAYPIGTRIAFIQKGDGYVSIRKESGVTIEALNSGNRTIGRNARGFLTKFATNSWFMTGDLLSEWPTGEDGPLLVGPGQTVNITAGDIKDYSDCTIDATGTLHIDDGDGWTIIGCAGTLTINGTIEARNGETGVDDTFASNEPDNTGALTGPALSYSIVQSVGGGGGTGIAPGGSSFFGNGGGGGGGPTNNGQDGILGFGGTGGAGTIFGCPGNATNPGGGAAIWGNMGGQGLQPGVCCGPTMRSAGGGGGSRGYHGQGLFLKVAGDITGSGTIDVSGRDGGAGGAGGGSGPCTTNGGGGGGGAGGSGGQAVVQYQGSLLGGFSSGNILDGKGFGGAGGGGNAGAAGADGSDGSSTLTAY